MGKEEKQRKKYLPPGSNVIRMGVALPPHILEQLRFVSQKAWLTQSFVIRTALELLWTTKEPYLTLSKSYEREHGKKGGEKP